MSLAPSHAPMRCLDQQLQEKIDFLRLNCDVLRLLVPYLSWPSLESLSLASKASQEAFGEASKSRVSISGTEPLLHFCESAEKHCQCRPCASSLSNERPDNSFAHDKINSRRLKPHIKHMELYEPGPIRGVGPNEEVRLMKLLSKLESFADSNSGGMIASATSLCPNLKTLKVLQTPLPFTLSLAASLIASCSKLKHLTYRTPHLDASALALAVCNLQELESFEVSGVRSCWCRGAVGRTQGMSELASALSRARKLKRMVFTACKVFSVDNCALLTKLGKASRDNTAICSHGLPLKDRNTVNAPQVKSWNGLEFSMSLSSLEIRRSPITGKSLAYFLSSPCCQNLTHLFVGGCVRVGMTHMIEGFKTNTCSSPMDLEIDGYLLSEELVKRVGSRLSNLRLFEPNEACLVGLRKALLDGILPCNLRLTIIPADEALPQWRNVQVSAGIQTTSSSLSEFEQLKTRHAISPGEIIRLLRERCSKSELRVGDEPWIRMREAIADRQWWAEHMMEKERSTTEVEADRDEWSGGVDVY